MPSAASRKPDAAPPNVEDAAKSWVDLKQRIKVLSDERAGLTKQLKEIEKTLRAHLEASETQTIVVDGHTIGLVTSVKEQQQ